MVVGCLLLVDCCWSFVFALCLWVVGCGLVFVWYVLLFVGLCLLVVDCRLYVVGQTCLVQCCRLLSDGCLLLLFWFLGLGRSLFGCCLGSSHWVPSFVWCLLLVVVWDLLGVGCALLSVGCW